MTALMLLIITISNWDTVTVQTTADREEETEESMQRGNRNKQVVKLDPVHYGKYEHAALENVWSCFS